MNTLPEEIERRAAALQLVMMDVDGVMTDGGILLDEQGRELKRFHIRDGHGIKLLRYYGILTALVTGRQSNAVAQRAYELGIDRVFQGTLDKSQPLRTLQEDYALAPSAIAYIGDDLVDLPVLREVGLAIAVADAHPTVLAAVHWITRMPGGWGAVREVADRLLSVQGHWESLLAHYDRHSP